MLRIFLFCLLAFFAGFITRMFWHFVCELTKAFCSSIEDPWPDGEVRYPTCGFSRSQFWCTRDTYHDGPCANHHTAGVRPL